jgi:type I restriction enzyme, R subunit
MTEQEIEQSLIEKLGDLKYTYRPDICDRAALEHNFREKFEALNHVHLTDSEFQQIVEYRHDPGNGYTRTQLAFAERKRG